MPTKFMEKKERRTTSSGSSVDLTFAIMRDDTPPPAPCLPLEIWVYSNDGFEPFIVVNPTLEIQFFRKLGQGSHNPSPFRGVVTLGELGNTGGLASSKAVIWRPTLHLSAEHLLVLDGMRDVEYGLHTKFKFEAVALPLARADRQPRAPEPLIWAEQFDVTNELWREWQAYFGWPRPRLFELSASAFLSVDDFDSAWRAIRDAERQYSLGHWPQVIAACRIAVEAVFRKLGYKGQGPYDWPALRAAGLPDEMRDLLKRFTGLTSLEHHPTGTQTEWRRADARFVLHVAVALAEYAATLPVRVA